MHRAATTRNGGRQIVFGLCHEYEHRRGGGLLDGFQQCIGRLLGHRPRFIEDEDFARRFHRRQRRLEDRRTCLFDGQRGPAVGIDQDQVGMVPRLHPPARGAGGGVLRRLGAEEGSREATGDGRLPDVRRTREEVGLRG